MSKPENQVATYDPEVIDLPHVSTSTANLILSNENMSNAIAFADIMASGTATVPRHLQKNRGDCLAITLQAMQWGMNPFAVAQKTHTVSGTLGYEAQLVNAVIIARAPITGRINYEWFGDWDSIAGRFKEVPAKNNADEKRIVRDWTIEDEKGLGVRVWATFRGETEPRELRLLLSQAGTRNSPLWGQDPKQQLAYLAVKRWSRLYCPDVILGVYTPDELEERAPGRNMGHAEVIRDLPPDDLVEAAQHAAALGVAAYQKFWTEAGKQNRTLLADYHEENKNTAIEVDRVAQAKADKAAARAAAAKTAKQESQSATPAANAAPEVTAKMVYDCLVAAFNAGDMEELNIAADMIRSVTDASQHGALTKEFESLRDALEGGPK